ncbi:PAS domain-containing sensor histidine kinase [Natronobiforma cellulositropha]|uniref:PAS domain-containing sensor histidine kinase n=1 Tax=Natronobiforma cellulositropha TaxID=1679076 RepID=UPI0021D5FABE|nr:PAS domain-containing sensor histidine kinase [Natronobiforma cellulositropha]
MTDNQELFGTERREVGERSDADRTLLDTVAVAIYEIDPAGRFTAVNEAFLEATGYEREQLLGQHAGLVFDATDVDRLVSTTRDSDGDVVTLAASVRCADGTRAPYELRSRRLERDGEFRGVAGVVRDFGVSDADEHLDYEEARERERELEHYEAIVETVTDGVYVLDQNYHFVMVNDAYAEMTGYDREELLGAHCSLVVGEEISSQAAEWSAKLAASDDTQHATIEAEIIRADGSLLPAESRFTPLSSPCGDFRGTVGVVRDVTDRREQERALEESERQYRTLVEHFPNGAVVLFDDDLHHIAAGGQLLEELTIETEHPDGWPIPEGGADDLADTVEPHFCAALEGEEHTFELEVDDRHLFAHTLPVNNADDEVFAGMLVAQDVTERRETRQKLEELVEKLAESNERLEQFAYAASHDLQEPLRMISSYLRLLEGRYGDDLDEDAQEFIAFAVDGADRMREMIDGLLTYSRVDTQGDPFERVDLEAVFEEALTDLQVTCDESDAQVTSEPLPSVWGDAGQLRQVFENLVSNAITYSGDEPPRVSVAAEREDDRWVISVADEGIGIECDDIQRIFEVFQRAHTWEENAGTGIGLALCQRIVERHDGDIWVESEPDVGSTFSFTLPVVDDRE